MFIPHLVIVRMDIDSTGMIINQRGDDNISMF